jgi:hypothetical protein
LTQPQAAAVPCHAVPWCEECSKYLTPSSLNDDGTCPTCGRQVGEIEERAAEEAVDESTPWHFKLLVVGLVVYLGWRFVEIFV